MGLDMYAVRKTHAKNWDSTSAKERYKVQIECGRKPVPGIQSDRVSGVEEQMMYWRKANHIHGWFVDNVQHGQDDQREYYVPWDKLRRLLSVCNKVMKASKLVDGYVYAGTIYDQENPKGLAQTKPGKVIEDATVARKLLPTRLGFFFGGTDYDQFYLQDVEDTRNFAARTLQDHADGVPGAIYYSSSW